MSMNEKNGKKNWMKKAFGKNKGGLHRALDVDPDKKIPAGKLDKALHSEDSHVRHMAQAAANANEKVNEREGDPCHCGSGHPSYWLNDAQGIPCGLVCQNCEEDLKKKYRPEMFSGYSQYDVDEPIEMEESKVNESVNLRSLIDGVRKINIEEALKEGMEPPLEVDGQESMWAPGEECVSPDTVQDDEVVGGYEAEESCTTPIDHDLKLSTARNAEVEQHMKDLKKEVGQDCQQKYADVHQTDGAESTSVEALISEEPREDMVLEEPKGEVSVEEGTDPEENEPEKKDDTDMPEDRVPHEDKTGSGDVSAAVDEHSYDLKVAAKEEMGKEKNRAKDKKPYSKLTPISYPTAIHPTKASEGKVNEDSWMNQLRKYKRQAYNYYENETKVVPTDEDILNYVCDQVEDASGADVDDSTAKSIARKLGLECDFGTNESKIKEMAHREGDQIFIKGNHKKGEIVIWHKKDYKCIEQDEYPIGTPGWWAAPVDDSGKRISVKDSKLNEIASEAGHYNVMGRHSGAYKMDPPLQHCACCGIELNTEELSSLNPEHCFNCQYGKCAVCGANESIVSINENKEFGASEVSDFRSMFEGARGSSVKESGGECNSCGDDSDHLYKGKCARCCRRIDRRNRQLDQDLTGQDRDHEMEMEAGTYESKGKKSKKPKEDFEYGHNCIICGKKTEKFGELCKKCGENENKDSWVNDSIESKLLDKFGLNEDFGGAMPGGGSATVAMDAGSIPPTKEDEPKVDAAQNPEMHGPDKEPEADEHGEKEYFGKQGDDNYYYIMAVSDDEGGSTGGIPSEDKPDVTPEVQSVDQAPVGEEELAGGAHESKLTTERQETIDPSDKDYRATAKAAYLMRHGKEVNKKEQGDDTQDKEIEDLEKSWKADNSKVPNESKARKIKEGFSSLQIIDASGKVVADAEEQDIDPNDIKAFLLKNMDELELTEIAPDIVKDYLLVPEDQKEDDDMTNTPKEEDRNKTQGQPPFKDEEVKPGENVASESKTINELLQKHGLIDPDGDSIHHDVYQEDIRTTLFDMPEDIMAQRLDISIEAAKEIKDLLRGSPMTTQPPLDAAKFAHMRGSVHEPPYESVLLEKFGLGEPVPDSIDALLEKFKVNEVGPGLFKAQPGTEPPQKEGETKEDLRDQDLTGKPVVPPKEDAAAPEAGAAQPIADIPPESATTVAGATAPGGSPTPDGTAEPIGPVSAKDMSTPESAKAYITSEYPEEPFQSTAIAFADSLIADPKIYGAVRDVKWGGIWGDSDTLEKQAKIVGEYGNFSPATVKALTDRFGNSAKYKLGRDIRPVIFITLRDVGADVEPVSLSELKGLSGARKAEATGLPGEVKLSY